MSVLSSHGMSYPNLTILGIDEVKRLDRPQVDFLLSILSPEDLLLPPAWVVQERWLSFGFADLDDPHAASGSYFPPTRSDVLLILAFGRQVLDQQAGREDPLTLLIHCSAGVSRSTAAGYAILCDWLGPGREAEAVQAVLAVRPVAQPNRLMVAYADDILARQGRMIETAQAFYERT